MYKNCLAYNMDSYLAREQSINDLHGEFLETCDRAYRMCRIVGRVIDWFPGTRRMGRMTCEAAKVACVETANEWRDKQLKLLRENLFDVLLACNDLRTACLEGEVPSDWNPFDDDPNT